MVPIGNVAFSLKFVPHHQDLRLSDIMGLLFILTGDGRTAILVYGSSPGHNYREVS